MQPFDLECVIGAWLRDGHPHEGSVGSNLYDDEHCFAYHAPGDQEYP